MNDDETIEKALQRLVRTSLNAFVRESNLIEGITRAPLKDEIDISLAFVAMAPPVAISHLEKFVSVIQPGATLRRDPGQDVIVGVHRPPPGGPFVPKRLQGLLDAINEGKLAPYAAHVEYEWLHPFLDGNGRSGRILWAWQMRQLGRHPFSLPFLHRWYYQSLDGART